VGKKPYPAFPPDVIQIDKQDFLGVFHSQPFVAPSISHGRNITSPGDGIA
jgi:hypothetical protein